MEAAFRPVEAFQSFARLKAAATCRVKPFSDRLFSRLGASPEGSPTPKKYVTGDEKDLSSLPFSKRAARRMIQRAWVLVGRDRNARQHVREARIVTLWVLEDWRFAWTVELDRGKIRYERRPARHPDLTLSWRTAEDFFRQIEGSTPAEIGFQMEGPVELQRLSAPLRHAFCNALQKVLRYPFDEQGNRLA